MASFVRVTLFAGGLALLLPAIPAGPAAAAVRETWTIGTLAGDPSVISAVRSREGRTDRYSLRGPARTVNDSPAAALDGTGRGALVWVRRTPGLDRLMLSRFDGSAWADPVAVVAGPHRLTNPAVSFAGRDVWVAWTFFDGRDTDVAAVRWQGFLSHPASFGTDLEPDYAPTISPDGHGGVFLTWTGWDGQGYRTFRSAFTNGAWGEASRLPARVPLEGTAPTPSVDRSPFDAGSPLAAAWTEGSAAVSVPLPPLDARVEAPAAVPEPLLSDAPYDRTYFMGLGDSTTYGRGSSMDGPPTDYVSRIESLLKGPWIAINRGVPGDRSDHVLERVDEELDRWRPGLTILSIGINDTFFGIDESVITHNIEVIAERVLARGGRLLLASTTPVMKSQRSLQYARLASLNPAVAALATARDWPFLDLWNILQARGDWETRYMEPITANHLNDAGYNLVAKRVRGLLVREGLLHGTFSWRAFDPPRPGQKTLDTNTGISIHVDDSFTPLAGPGLTQVAAMDVDGNGIDELGVITTMDTLDGTTQVFTLYQAPPAGSFDAEGLLAAVVPIAAGDWLDPVDGLATHLFSLDLDGDGMDEIGLVRFFPRGARQALEIWRAHQPGDAPAERLVLDKWRIPVQGRIRDVSGIQADGDPADELLVLTEVNLTGEQRIRVFDTPAAGSDTPEENVTRQLDSFPPPHPKITQVVGMDITPEDGLGLDEIVLLRAGRMGFYDRIETYAFPPLPTPRGTKLTRLTRDRWVRAAGPHAYLVDRVDLDDGAGGALTTLGVWEDR